MRTAQKGLVLFIFKENGPLEISSAMIDKSPIVCEKANNVELMKGNGISKKRLIAALELLINNGLRRQNNNTCSPTYGNLYAFMFWKQN